MFRSVLFGFVMAFTFSASADPIFGRWRMAHRSCLSDSGDVIRHMPKSLFDLMTTKDIEFSDDGQFKLQAQLMWGCRVRARGKYQLNEMTLKMMTNVQSSFDGPLMNCFNLNDLAIESQLVEVHWIDRYTFFILDHKEPADETRCKEGESPIQLFRKIRK